MSARYFPFLAMLLMLVPLTSVANPEMEIPGEEAESQVAVEIWMEDAKQLLDDVDSLQSEVRFLTKNQNKMNTELRELQSKLNRVSIASILARDYVRQMKVLQPIFQETTEVLHEKSSELASKRLSLRLIVDKLSAHQDKIGGSLLDILHN